MANIWRNFKLFKRPKLKRLKLSKMFGHHEIIPFQKMFFIGSDSALQGRGCCLWKYKINFIEQSCNSWNCFFQSYQTACLNIHAEYWRWNVTNLLLLVALSTNHSLSPVWCYTALQMEICIQTCWPLSITCADFMRLKIYVSYYRSFLRMWGHIDWWQGREDGAMKVTRD